jgi:hypothetical protein
MRSRLPAAIVAAGCVLQPACRVPHAGTDWNEGAARTVARHVQAADPGTWLVVLGSIGGAAGAELPWAVRQSLTTGGIEVGDTSALRQPDTALLVFESASRTEGEWIMETRLERAEPAAAALPDRARWRVRCTGDQCTIVEVQRRGGDQ